MVGSRGLDAGWDAEWTDVPVAKLSIKDLSPDAIMGFRVLARSAGRLSQEEFDLESEDLLDKLNLLRDGMLTRAAVLLFHLDPGKVLGPVSLKIGMFDGPDLLYQDEFTGPLIFMANRTMDTLMTKYTVKPISYDGFVRIETSPYPESAVREAVMNAIVHNDYSSHVPIQIKVFREGLIIYNEGGLPVGWTLDRLMGQHKSLPRNPTLASVFYRAGLIEAFGRGIGKIMSQFEGRHEFDPVFEADSGFSVTFKNEVFYKANACPGSCCAEKAIMGYLEAHGSGTYGEIVAGTGLSSRQVQRTAGALSDRGLVIKEKRGRKVVLRPSGRSVRAPFRVDRAQLVSMAYMSSFHGIHGIHDVRICSLLGSDSVSRCGSRRKRHK